MNELVGQLRGYGQWFRQLAFGPELVLRPMPWASRW